MSVGRMEAHIMNNINDMMVKMEGFPVEYDCDILLQNLLGNRGTMDFDDSFDDDIDENILRNLPLDFPFENEEKTKEATDEDSGIGSHHADVSPLGEPPVDVPEDFPFPFTPYDIQVGFMKNIYRSLELGKIGIFESPTGTGKSLSLICGALRWLKDHEERKRQELEQLLQDKSSPRAAHTTIKQEAPDPAPADDWITAFARKQEEEEASKKLQEEREQRIKREQRLKELRDNLRPNPKYKRKRDKLEEEFDDLFKDASREMKELMKTELDNTENVTSQDANHDDDHIVVDEYLSDDEGGGGRGEGAGNEEEEEVDLNDHVTKIYFCSRTHSQLAQFVREVQKSPYGEETRVVTLGSRQNLCINDAVKRLKSLSLINDRCLELQKHKTSSKKKDGESVPKKKKTMGGCPFYKQDNLAEFRDRVMVEVKDIEQLVGMGKQTKACPYYGTRHSIPMAQLVALPYNLLLHKSARQASGIKLHGNIVVVDEAHNLVETISNVHSIEMTGAQVTCAVSQLTQYMERYRKRLKAKNLMYIKQIIFILNSFIKALGGKPGVSTDQQQSRKKETKLLTINDFLFSTQLDNLNLFKVMRYCQRSLISKKLHGFVEKYQPSMVQTAAEKKEEEGGTWALSKFLKEISQERDNNSPASSPQKSAGESARGEESQPTFSSPLMHIEGFLEALTNANKDGRIVINKQELVSKSSLKFLLLNPAVHFAEVLKEARAVIVAGGTMQPISEFKDQLFYAAGVEPSRILEYSCGHVIPRENILPLALARGSSGQELDFTYQNRDLPSMMDELGRVVYNVCNISPGGVVCFFPSYEYERAVYKHWEAAGFLEKMCAKKKIFREPKSASLVEHTLTEYATCIRRNMANKYSSCSGALLLCVVGGKMSEGINFSDDLGRCVILVGLPYPNLRSPELKEKMDYLNANMPRLPDGKMPGQLHYENLCMKAVNQSIGRAIRHRGDYSSILLLDHRYLRPSMKSKLPAWISDRLECKDRFGPAFAALRKFYAEKRRMEEDSQ